MKDNQRKAMFAKMHDKAFQDIRNYGYSNESKKIPSSKFNSIEYDVRLKNIPHRNPSRSWDVEINSPNNRHIEKSFSNLDDAEDFLKSDWEEKYFIKR